MRANFRTSARNATRRLEHLRGEAGNRAFPKYVVGLQLCHGTPGRAGGLDCGRSQAAGVKRTTGG